MTATVERLTAREVLARLERHYIKPGAPLPGGVFLPEVTMGRQGGRRCDALYVGFTSTSGRLLIGHEIKVSRADWLHELGQVGKADAWADQCHGWYVVAPLGVVEPAELPDGWGLMVPQAVTTTRLRIMVKARVHADRSPDWNAALSIISRADTLRAGAIEKGRQDARAKARAELDELVARGVESRMHGQQDVTVLRERLATVQDALGVRVVSDRSFVDAKGGEVHVDDLRAVTKAAQAVGSLREVTDRFGSPYWSPTAGLRRLVDDMDAALTQLKSAVADTTGAG